MNDHATQLGGLGELPAAVGPSDRQQQELNEAWNTYQEIEDRLALSGVSQPTIPREVMPTVSVEVLRGLSGNEYMETYAALDSWHNFVGETISQLENIILQVNNEMEDLEVHIRKNLIDTTEGSGGRKPSAEDLKYAVKIHPRHRWLKLELQKNKQHLNRLEAKQKSLGRAEKMMSRNIERVKAAMESAGGYGGIQSRAPGQLPPRFG
jgi:hypothetical protein